MARAVIPILVARPPDRTSLHTVRDGVMPRGVAPPCTSLGYLRRTRAAREGLVRCRCACGATCAVPEPLVRVVSSCGCVPGTVADAVWTDMILSCTRRDYAGYAARGARGQWVHGMWRGADGHAAFARWFAHNRPRVPARLSLSPNCSGYHPRYVRWITDGARVPVQGWNPHW